MRISSTLLSPSCKEPTHSPGTTTQDWDLSFCCWAARFCTLPSDLVGTSHGSSAVLSTSSSAGPDTFGDWNRYHQTGRAEERLSSLLFGLQYGTWRCR